MSHQLGVQGDVVGYVDKRRGYRDDFETRVVGGPTLFTANAGGTTTTIVGANASYPGGAATVNAPRFGEEFKLFTSGNVLKQETVFRVTNIVVAGSTTVTFAPAALVATVSGDQMKPVGFANTYSNAEMDRRLVELGFSAARVATMTENDKLYQIRVSDDPGSL